MEFTGHPNIFKIDNKSQQLEPTENFVPGCIAMPGPGCVTHLYARSIGQQRRGNNKTIST